MKLHQRVISNLSLVSVILLSLLQSVSAQEMCTQSGTERIAGKEGNYNYELWNQYGQGTGCMTLGSGGSFSGHWSGIQNYLARRGFSYNETETHTQIGTFSTTYSCNYVPNSSSGNSYLAVYGWTSDPLVEYYIIEDWRNWIPSMAQGTQSLGTLSIDGGIYDIYVADRINQPSIKGDTTFKQYFSIRRTKRSSGTISISEHFKKWESLQMPLGKLYEVAFVVEGYQSSGTFDFQSLEISVGSTPSLLSTKSSSAVPYQISQNNSTKSLQIQVDKSIIEPSIQILDVMGKVIYESSHQSSLSVFGMATGTYFVKIANATHYYTSTILIP